MARPKGTTKSGLKYLNEDQLKAFNNALERGKCLRDQAMMRLCLYLGLRVQELVNIRMQDIERESQSITVKALKRGRTRTYSALGEPLWALLMRYIKKEKPSDRLFPVTAQTAKNIFKKYAKQAGLNASYSIHNLRHTCGIIQAKSGHSPIQIMLWLRHRDIVSTMIYVQQVVFEKDDERMNQLMQPFL